MNRNVQHGQRRHRPPSLLVPSIALVLAVMALCGVVWMAVALR